MDVVVELEDDVLPAPPQPDHATAAGCVLDRRRRRRLAPARIEHLHPLERAPLDHRRQVTPDRLDLGQLGHAPEVRSITTNSGTKGSWAAPPDGRVPVFGRYAPSI